MKAKIFLLLLLSTLSIHFTCNTQPPPPDFADFEAFLKELEKEIELEQKKRKEKEVVKAKPKVEHRRGVEKQLPPTKPTIIGEEEKTETKLEALDDLIDLKKQLDIVNADLRKDIFDDTAFKKRILVQTKAKPEDKHDFHSILGEILSKKLYRREYEKVAHKVTHQAIDKARADLTDLHTQIAELDKKRKEELERIKAELEKGTGKTFPTEESIEDEILLQMKLPKSKRETEGFSQSFKNKKNRIQNRISQALTITVPDITTKLVALTETEQIAKAKEEKIKKAEKVEKEAQRWVQKQAKGYRDRGQRDWGRRPGREWNTTGKGAPPPYGGNPYQYSKTPYQSARDTVKKGPSEEDKKKDPSYIGNKKKKKKEREEKLEKTPVIVLLKEATELINMMGGLVKELSSIHDEKLTPIVRDNTFNCRDLEERILTISRKLGSEQAKLEQQKAGKEWDQAFRSLQNSIISNFKIFTYLGIERLDGVNETKAGRFKPNFLRDGAKHIKKAYTLLPKIAPPEIIKKLANQSTIALKNLNIDNNKFASQAVSTLSDAKTYLSIQHTLQQTNPHKLFNAEKALELLVQCLLFINSDFVKKHFPKKIVTIDKTTFVSAIRENKALASAKFSPILQKSIMSVQKQPESVAYFNSLKSEVERILKTDYNVGPEEGFEFEHVAYLTLSGQGVSFPPPKGIQLQQPPDFNAVFKQRLDIEVSTPLNAPVDGKMTAKKHTYRQVVKYNLLSASLNSLDEILVLLGQVENMTKKTNLAVPPITYKVLKVIDAIYGGVDIEANQIVIMNDPHLCDVVTGKWQFFAGRALAGEIPELKEEIGIFRRIGGAAVGAGKKAIGGVVGAVKWLGRKIGFGGEEAPAEAEQAEPTQPTIPTSAKDITIETGMFADGSRYSATKALAKESPQKFKLAIDYTIVKERCSPQLFKSNEEVVLSCKVTKPIKKPTEPVEFRPAEPPTEEPPAVAPPSEEPPPPVTEREPEVEEEEEAPGVGERIVGGAMAVGSAVGTGAKVLFNLGSNALGYLWRKATRAPEPEPDEAQLARVLQEELERRRRAGI